MNEAVINDASRFDTLADRLQHLAEITEHVRLEEKVHKFNVESAFEQLKELEGAVARNDEEARKLVLKETQSCKNDLQRVQQQIINEQGKQVAELQSKLVDRFHQETSTREAATRQVYEEMEKAMSARSPPAKVGTVTGPSLSTKEGSTTNLSSTMQSPGHSFGYSSPTSKILMSGSSQAGFSTPRTTFGPRTSHATPIVMTMGRAVPGGRSPGIATPFAGIGTPSACVGVQAPGLRIRSASMEVRPRPGVI